jgi:branched-chain amino acid transport system ATP-binding protein
MGLAPVIVDQLFAVLADRVAAGTTVLLVEQYVDTALALADYVTVLDKGRVVAVGEPADIRERGLTGAYLGA